MKKSAKYYLTHPVSLLSAVATGAATALDPATTLAIAAGLWAQIGTLFTALSVSAFTLFPKIEALSPYAGIATGLALTAGGVYAIKLLSRVWETVEQRL